MIAKAYGRIGSAYQRKGDLPTAVKFFQKSLTEHRTPDVLNKLRQAERDAAEKDASDWEKKYKELRQKYSELKKSAARK